MRSETLWAVGLIAAVTSASATPVKADAIDAIIQVTAGTGGHAAINAINVANGDVTRLYTDPTAGTAFNAAAYDPTNGLVYFEGNITASGATLYSFNPSDRSGGITKLGTVSVGSASAGWYNGLYYAIESGNKLVAYNLAAGDLTPVSTTTLNLTGTGLTSLGQGVGNGDIDFGANGQVYITAELTTTSGAVHASLFEYDSLSDITAPPSVTSNSTAQADFSNGIAYDSIDGLLYGYNTFNDNFYSINPDTLKRISIIATDPANFSVGGDLTAAFELPTPVPEASTWAMLLLGFAGLGFVGHRSSRRNAAAA